MGDVRVLGEKSDTPVTFFLAGVQDLEALATLDPDRDLDSFRLGERSWVLQTYLRLRQAGFAVALASAPPSRGLVVFHAKQKRALAQLARGRRELTFVGIRADNSSPLLADFEILQNGRFADDRHRFAVPFWPQPGLLPRDPARGERFERVGYVGLLENLHPDFRQPGWVAALREIGLEWVPRAVAFRQVGQGADVDWEDYRALDALIAVRPYEPRLSFCKPANKLINAWRAGVPALVGPEFAFRELWRSELDFVEVTGRDEALAALQSLQNDPDRVRRMVARGRERAAEFSFAAVTERWAELLFELIPSRLAAEGLPWMHRLPIPVRLPLRRFVRWVTRRPRR